MTLPLGSRIGDLTVADVVQWLQGAGWSSGAGRSPVGRLWRKGHDEVLVPIDSDMPDFGLRLATLVRDLAVLAAISPDALAQQMLARGSDVFEWRALTADGGQTLPLSVAEEFVGGMAGSYRAAAAAALRRMGHFGHRMPRRARDHVRDLMLGQTRAGSYIIPVITRIAAVDFSPDDEALFRYEVSAATRDFASRTNRVLYDALAATKEVCEAATAPNAAKINQLVVESGVSSELTSSIARIVDVPSLAAVEVRVAWAGEREPPSPVTFGRRDSSVLHAITDSLRNRSQARLVRLEVNVNRLSRGLSDVRGAVSFRAQVDDAERSVLAYLNDDQYHIASAANDARVPAYVTGTLVEQDGQAWRLDDVVEISLTPQDLLST